MVDYLHPVALYDPAAHCTGATEVEEQLYPAGQSVQLVLPIREYLAEINMNYIPTLYAQIWNGIRTIMARTKNNVHQIIN